ncbi:MAG: ParB/RepB/Spo0J family partition protein [Synergistaceae bacterium]|jgi:ParB family chromosome partitioning protein|nr:ParB/RepB/Spo0J family partition protein [Synergistaceae bacterium]
MAVKALGKGLSALLGDSERPSSEKLLRVPVGNIHPDPAQPRGELDREALASLTESVRRHGILQPLLLKAVGDSRDYQIVAGERRWRAAMAAGLEDVPARILDVTEESRREISLIENIQREDLSPLEVAAALRTLMTTFRLTQEETASRIGWSRVAVANRLRLLNLPEAIREMLAGERLSEGHARALLTLKNPEAMMELARRAENGGMTVRQLEAAVRAQGNDADTAREPNPRAVRLALPAGLNALARTHGVKIRISQAGNASRIVLDNLRGVDKKKLEDVLERLLKKLFAEENRKEGK